MTFEGAKAKYPSRFNSNNSDFRYMLYIVATDDKDPDNQSFAGWNLDRQFEFAAENGCKNLNELYRKFDDIEDRYNKWLAEKVIGKNVIP